MQAAIWGDGRDGKRIRPWFSSGPRPAVQGLSRRSSITGQTPTAPGPWWWSQGWFKEVKEVQGGVWDRGCAAAAGRMDAPLWIWKERLDCKRGLENKALQRSGEQQSVIFNDLIIIFISGCSDSAGTQVLSRACVNTGYGALQPLACSVINFSSSFPLGVGNKACLLL